MCGPTFVYARIAKMLTENEFVILRPIASSLMKKKHSTHLEPWDRYKSPTFQDEIAKLVESKYVVLSGPLPICDITITIAGENAVKKYEHHLQNHVLQYFYDNVERERNLMTQPFTLTELERIVPIDAQNLANSVIGKMQKEGLLRSRQEGAVIIYLLTKKGAKQAMKSVRLARRIPWREIAIIIGIFGGLPTIIGYFRTASHPIAKESSPTQSQSQPIQLPAVPATLPSTMPHSTTTP